jgi:Cu-Zn family superoxide dismutase
MATAKGLCVLRGASGVRGVVQFRQGAGDPNVAVSGRVTGLSPGYHGLRVLMFGDLSDEPTYSSMGSVYNPYGRAHADREAADRPTGALGNVHADEHGVADFAFLDPGLKIFGPLSILGRGLVVTQRPDDALDGNAGPIVAAGVIGVASSA